jgi:hypothetical protein
MTQLRQVTPTIVVSIKLVAFGIAISLFSLLYDYGFNDWVAIGLGVVAYIVAKAILSVAIGYVWGRKDARETKAYLAKLPPKVKQDIIDNPLPDVKQRVADAINKNQSQVIAEAQTKPSETDERNEGRIGFSPPASSQRSRTMLIGAIVLLLIGAAPAYLLWQHQTLLAEQTALQRQLPRKISDTITLTSVRLELTHLTLIYHLSVPRTSIDFPALESDERRRICASKFSNYRQEYWDRSGNFVGRFEIGSCH